MITPSAANLASYNLHTQLRDIHTRLPSAVAAIRRRIGELDGYSAGSSEVVVATSRGSSTVERAAGHTLPLTDTLTDIAYRLDQLAVHTRMLEDHIRRHAPPVISAADKSALRCTGGNTLESWSRPECTNIADAGGLCPACRMRRHRWTTTTEAERA